MMNSYDYVEGRVADQRSVVERHRRAASVDARPMSMQQLGEMLRQRTKKSPKHLDH